MYAESLKNRWRKIALTKSSINDKMPWHISWISSCDKDICGSPDHYDVIIMVKGFIPAHVHTASEYFVLLWLCNHLFWYRKLGYPFYYTHATRAWAILLPSTRKAILSHKGKLKIVLKIKSQFIQHIFSCVAHLSAGNSTQLKYWIFFCTSF